MESLRTGQQRILQADVIVNAAGLWAQSVAHTFAGLPAATVPKLHVARGCYFELKGGQGVVIPCHPAAIFPFQACLAVIRSAHVSHIWEFKLERLRVVLRGAGDSPFSHQVYPSESPEPQHRSYCLTHIGRSAPRIAIAFPLRALHAQMRCAPVAPAASKGENIDAVLDAWKHSCLIAAPQLLTK